MYGIDRLPKKIHDKQIRSQNTSNQSPSTFLTITHLFGSVIVPECFYLFAIALNNSDGGGDKGGDQLLS